MEKGWYNLKREGLRATGAIRFKGRGFVEGFRQTRARGYMGPKGKVVLFQPLDMANSLLLKECNRSGRVLWLVGVTHQVDTVHYADAKGHIRLGEVDDLLTLCCDG